MIIQDIDATWLHCPIPPEKQHISDFGRMDSFNMTLVTVTTEEGLVGYGEAKSGVGNLGDGTALVNLIRHELRPLLVGQDARRITRLWEMMYNGPRDHYARARGRAFPVLGRRGLTVCAMSGIDMALWDLLGKAHDVPVAQLLGGAVREQMPAYASGGWADADGIGAQLRSYVDRGGFGAVKMRVGVMDGTVAASVARVQAARDGLGPEIDIMVDAHGTFSVPEAQRFARQLEECNLRWFEEPISPDNYRGTAAVRAATTIPISAGESEFTRFDFRDLIAADAVDILQPDLAICGGISEGRRIAALADTYQLELAPHCWGSAFSFMAGVNLAFASPAAIIIEFSLGANPLLHDLVEEPITVTDGVMHAPAGPGLGVTPRPDFIQEFQRVP